MRKIKHAYTKLENSALRIDKQHLTHIFREKKKNNTSLTMQIIHEPIHIQSIVSLTCKHKQRKIINIVSIKIQNCNENSQKEKFFFF